MLGSYSYGYSAHLHAATSVSSGYTATYDAAGDMTCRAPSSSTTCSGSPTGQQLTWDAEGRLAAWQNAPTAPTTTASYLYDGEGNRVVQQVNDTTAGTTTTTSYVGSLETVISNGTTPPTTTTTDYAAAGSVLAESVNGTLSYLVTTYQGSIVEALDGSGTVTASQLYAPYGGVRYASGALPTDYGYTGQRADTSTGLDYYGARYYDPTLGQFTSADTWLAGGLNRYGYVGGNPTTATDPSGHMVDYGAETGGFWACPPLAPAPSPQTDEMSRVRRGEGLPGFDELTGALARNSGGISLSDLPYWNRHNVPNRPTSPPTPTPTDTTLTDAGGKPGGGGSSGSGSSGGGGGNGGQPQQQSGSGEDTAVPEPEPQPSTGGSMRGGGIRCDDPEVLRLGACVHDYQMNTIGGRGRTYPCAGTCRIRGTLDVPFGMYQSTKVEGHAEWQTFWAVYETIPRGMEGGTLLIDYVIAYSPCGNCQESIPDMNRMVRSRAGPNVDITIRWWYLSSKGEVRPWPKTP